MVSRVKEHVLKTAPKFFDAVLQGVKPFEVRRNDRDYREGDVLVLREWYPGAHRYSGRELRRRVMYVLQHTASPELGLKPGHVVLGLEIPQDLQAYADRILARRVLEWLARSFGEELEDDRCPPALRAAVHEHTAVAMGSDFGEIRGRVDALLSNAVDEESVRCTCEWASENDGSVGLLYPHVLDSYCAVHGAPTEFAPGAEYERVYTGLKQLAGANELRALAALWYGPDMAPGEPPRWAAVRHEWPVFAAGMDRLVTPVAPGGDDVPFAHCEGCTAGIRHSEGYHAWNDGVYTCTSCGGPPGTLFCNGAYVPVGEA